MKKKFLAMLLALVMVLSLLSACGQGSASVTSEPVSESVAAESVVAENPVAEEPDVAVSAEEEPDAEEPASEEPVVEVVEREPVSLPIAAEETTYTMWTTLHPAYMNYVTDLAELTVWAEVAARTNIGFDFTAVSGITASDNFNLMIAGGDYCDVITEMDLFSEGVDAAIEQEIITDLNGKIQELAPSYWDIISADPQAYLTMVTDNGAIGTIAAVRGNTVSTDLNGLLVRGDWLKEFGMSDPGTLDELKAYLEKARDTYGAVIEFAADGIAGTLMPAFNLDGDFIVVDGQVESTYMSDAFRDYLETSVQWYNEGIIDPNFYTVEDTTENASKVANGQYSLANGSAQSFSRILQYVTDPDSTIELYPITYVPNTAGEEIHVGQTSPLIIDQDCWAIAASCDAVDPLLVLVEYMFSEEGQLLYNYGVEDDTFTYDAQGKPQWTEKMTADPERAFDIQEYLYATATIPSVRDYSREAFNFSESEQRAMDIFGDMTDGAYNYPSYAVLTTDESSAYTALESDLETYAETAILAFITGQTELTDESYDEFQNTLIDMGIEEMTEMKQAAYDRAMEKYSAIAQ